MRFNLMNFAVFVLLTTLVLTTLANRLLPDMDSDDDYHQHLQQLAADDSYFSTGGAKVEPFDGDLLEAQPLKRRSDAGPLTSPEKRHVCRAKYVYNPVSGRCQPSLSALRGQGR